MYGCLSKILAIFFFCDSDRVCDVDDDAVCLMHNACGGMHGT